MEKIGYAWDKEFSTITDEEALETGRELFAQGFRRQVSAIEIGDSFQHKTVGEVVHSLNKAERKDFREDDNVKIAPHYSNENGEEICYTRSVAIWIRETPPT